MRLGSTRDLGLYVRDQRRQRDMTQLDLAVAAQVSRRWLSDLEAGKPSAEIGLVFRVLHALQVTLEAHPSKVAEGSIDLDSLLRELGGDGSEGADRG